jgi:SSS family solute:Na+ symporter
LLGGHAVSAILFALSIMEIMSLHFTIIAGLLALVSVIIFVVVSGASKPPLEEQVRQFTFHAETMERQASLCWWQDYRLHSLVLVLLATALVIAHW